MHLTCLFAPADAVAPSCQGASGLAFGAKNKAWVSTWPPFCGDSNTQIPQGRTACPPPRNQMTDSTFLNLVLEEPIISHFGVEINRHPSQRSLGLHLSCLGVLLMALQDLMQVCDVIGARCCYEIDKGRQASGLESHLVHQEYRGQDVSSESLPILGHICLAGFYN